MRYSLDDTGLQGSYPDTGWLTFEFILGMMIASYRGLPLYLENQKNKVWHHSQQRTIHGKKVAIIGNGGIARKFRHLAFIFQDTQIDRFSRTGSKDSMLVEKFYENVEDYDVIIVLVPLNETTVNMFNKNIFSRIKDDALFINMSYGQVVNTDDLVEELNKDRFFAVLDQVYPNPLPQDHPLWDCPNLIITPHVASNAR